MLPFPHAPPHGGRDHLSRSVAEVFFVAEDNKGCKNILKDLDYCHGRPWARAIKYFALL
jgi:hypothetical protein